jgi:hypothetical protein
MPVSKKQAAHRAKGLKDKIAELERELKMPVMDKVKRSNLEYELARLKKKL